MADLVAADAAFEGFRIPREKPRVVLVWALLHLVMGVFMTAVMISVGGDAMARFVTLSQERNPDPAATMAAFQQLAPVYAALLPPGLLVQSVFSAAIYRVVLRPADSSLAYLRLGPDELRIALLMMIYVGFGALATFAVTFVGALAAAVLGMFAGPLAGFLGFLIGSAGLGAMIYAGVRLSLAPAQTFAERRLVLFDSWALTKGHFWGLAGAYLLAAALALIVLLLAMMLYSGVSAALHGGSLENAMRNISGDMSTLGTYFTPATTVYVAFSSLLNALSYALIFAPGAVAYRQLAQHGVGDTFR